MTETIEPERRRWRSWRRLAVLAVWLTEMASAQPGHAQEAARAAPPVPADPITFPAPAAPPSPPAAPVAPPATAATAPAAPPQGTSNIRDLTEQLVALERQAQQLEQARADIRHRGMRIGKYISWAAFGVLASQSLTFLSRAELTKEAREDGRSDKAYDVDGDGDVDVHDERRARRIARGLLLGSLVPLGLGVYTTVMGRMRARRDRQLAAELDDVRGRRRRLIDRLAYDLGVSGTHAAVSLRLTF